MQLPCEVDTQEHHTVFVCPTVPWASGVVVALQHAHALGSYRQHLCPYRQHLARCNIRPGTAWVRRCGTASQLYDAPDWGSCCAKWSPPAAQLASNHRLAGQCSAKQSLVCTIAYEPPISLRLKLMDGAQQEPLALGPFTLLLCKPLDGKNAAACYMTWQRNSHVCELAGTSTCTPASNPASSS